MPFKMKFSNRAQKLAVACCFQYNSSDISRASRRFKSSGMLTSCLVVNTDVSVESNAFISRFKQSRTVHQSTRRNISDVLSIYHKLCESLKFRSEYKVFLIVPYMIVCVCTCIWEWRPAVETVLSGILSCSFTVTCSGLH